MLTRILFCGLLVSTLMFAQRGGGGGGGSKGGGGGMGAGGFSQGSRLDRLSDALKLSKDQKKDVKTTMDDAQKEASPVHEQMNKSRLAIAEAIAAGKPQDEVDKAVRSEGALESQLTEIELRAFAKIIGGMETDQKQRGIPMVFALVHGAFNGKNWNTDQ
jgi:Spy/CpxP family protein refolding chaperone